MPKSYSSFAYWVTLLLLNLAQTSFAGVNFAGLENGSITGGLLENPGETATLMAIPNPGYLFDGWTGDASGTANPLVLVMTANVNLGAKFSPDLADSDSDGISNYAELATYHTDPVNADSDADLFGDGFEVSRGTDPVLFASKPSNLLQMQKAIETSTLGIGGCFGLSGSDDLIASHERIGNGRVHVSRIDEGGGVNKLFTIDAPHRSYDSPGFGSGLSLCGDRLMIGNPVTWIHAPHDGCAYMYSIGAEGPVLKEIYDNSPRTAGYHGAMVFCTEKSSFSLAPGHDWYNSSSLIHCWSEASATKPNSLTHTVDLPHYIGGFAVNPQGNLLTLYREHDGVRNITQFSRGADLKFVELRSKVASMTESYIAWNQKRIAEYNGTVYATDKTRLAWYVPQGTGFAEHFLDLSTISPGSEFNAQWLLIKDNYLFVSSVSSVVRSSSTGVILAFDLAGSDGTPVFREAITLPDVISGGNFGLSMTTADLHNQFIVTSGNSDKRRFQVSSGTGVA